MDQPETSMKSNILVAPLDWGLGHATRCIPIIKSLISQNASPVLAGQGKVRKLLEKEFPLLRFADLKGYEINYSRSKWTLPFVMATQIPKILSAIKHENERLNQIVEKYEINGIISDNRFGLYHETIPSVFITHQLLIRTGLGSFADEILQDLNYDHINEYSQCWIPDLESNDNLSGDLSHPKKLPEIPLHYIGPLSRFKKENGAEQKHILIILSGPEPQRTMLEEIILDQLEWHNGPVVLVRGLPGEIENINVAVNVTVYNHLCASELQVYINQSSFIISRCGYSTVMDLSVTGKKSILIPTPGQTEQEYLARHLMKKNFALCIDQEKFRLRTALELAASFPYKFLEMDTNGLLDDRVKEFLVGVKKGHHATN